MHLLVLSCKRCTMAAGYGAGAQADKIDLHVQWKWGQSHASATRKGHHIRVRPCSTAEGVFILK